jgi:hypothetical protein
MFSNYLVNHAKLLSVFYTLSKWYAQAERKAVAVYRCLLKDSIVHVRTINTHDRVVSSIFSTNWLKLFCYALCRLLNISYQLKREWERQTTDNMQSYIELQFANHKDRVIIRSTQSFVVPKDFDHTNQTSLVCVEIVTKDNRQHDITKFFDLYRHSFVERSAFSTREVIELYNTLKWCDVPNDSSIIIVNGNNLDETIYTDNDILTL